MLTTLSEAFRKVGITKPQMAVYSACAEFIESGGTREQWIEIYELTAKKFNGGGQKDIAGNGRHDSATAVEPKSNSGDGQGRIVGNGQGLSAIAAGSKENGGGPGKRSGNGLTSHAAPVLAKAPTTASVTALARVKEKVALSVLDREMTRTGQPWGNVQYIALDGMMDDGGMAAEVKKYIGSITGGRRFKTIRELVTPREFHTILRKAGRKPDAA